jgi:hypothetical protein
MRDGFHRRFMKRRRAKAQIAHRTQLKGNAQAVSIATVRRDKGPILLGEGEVGYQVPVGNVIRKTRKSFPLFGGQKGPRHSVPHRLSKRVSGGGCMEAMEIKAFFMAK